MKKRLVAILLVLAVMFTALSGAVMAAADLPFEDVSMADWFYDAVEYVYKNDVMNGTGETTFSPNLPMSRGMVVTALHRLAGEEDGYAAEFSGVAEGQYYSRAVDWASTWGIVEGYGNGKFGPNDYVTREQLVQILFRYAEYCGDAAADRAELVDYKDVADISDYALDAMQWAVAENLVEGSNYCLNPRGLATRAQFAAILMRQAAGGLLFGVGMNGKQSNVRYGYFVEDTRDSYVFNAQQNRAYAMDVVKYDEKAGTKTVSADQAMEYETWKSAELSEGTAAMGRLGRYVVNQAGNIEVQKDSDWAVLAPAGAYLLKGQTAIVGTNVKTDENTQFMVRTYNQSSRTYSYDVYIGCNNLPATLFAQKNGNRIQYLTQARTNLASHVFVDVQGGGVERDFFVLKLVSVDFETALYPWLSGYTVYQILMDGQISYLAATTGTVLRAGQPYSAELIAMEGITINGREIYLTQEAAVIKKSAQLPADRELSVSELRDNIGVEIRDDAPISIVVYDEFDKYEINTFYGEDRDAEFADFMSCTSGEFAKMTVYCGKSRGIALDTSEIWIVLDKQPETAKTLKSFVPVGCLADGAFSDTYPELDAYELWLCYDIHWGDNMIVAYPKRASIGNGAAYILAKVAESDIVVDFGHYECAVYFAEEGEAEFVESAPVKDIPVESLSGMADIVALFEGCTIDEETMVRFWFTSKELFYPYYQDAEITAHLQANAGKKLSACALIDENNVIKEMWVEIQ